MKCTSVHVATGVYLCLQFKGSGGESVASWIITALVIMRFKADPHHHLCLLSAHSVCPTKCEGNMTRRSVFTCQYAPVPP